MQKLLGRLKATKPTYCFETTVPRSTEGRLLRASSWDWCGGWRMEKSKGMENSKGMEKSKGKRHQKHDNKQNPEMNGVFSTFGRVGSVGSIVGGNKK